ncbi:MAG: rod shape-determining protein RodA [Prevotellaceae bacterium]|jgi:rod shape determining protein RodA|nr:rod shape-determining protein RodA [Prevotellaceae bacterium]
MKSIFFFKKLDWVSIGIYLALVVIGCISIFASIYNKEAGTILDIFDTSQRYGLQLVWFVSALIIIIIIFLINSKFYSVFALAIYLFIILSLVAVLIFGVEVKGSKSWFDIAGIRLQPAEFAKIACSLALARIMSAHDFKVTTFRGISIVLCIILLPPLLILLEHETGLALVFAAFFLVLYREGLSGWVLIFGIFAIMLFVLSILWEQIPLFILIASVCTMAYGLISGKWKHVLLICVLFAVAYILLPNFLGNQMGLFINNGYWFLILLSPIILLGAVYAFRSRIHALWGVLICTIASFILVFSIDYLVHNILQPHQKTRIHILLGVEEYLQGAGYNVHQSKVAIGSGGFTGKGFLRGTQTRYNFVPEQTTDFIFCTIGEEWGFLGSFVVIILFLILFYRIILIAERQKDLFARIYGYCVASCLFFHFFVNIGMTIGLMPVIGIPLPFISYGGSSLLAFTILLFILLKLDASR